MYFPTTHWSLLAQASLAGETAARAALDELCRRYWRPLNQFLRMRGYSETDAEDLTQAFLLHLLERSALSKADQFRGKFRSFLLGALVKFLAHERNYRQAQKRGGQSLHLSIEALSEENVEVPAMPETDVKAFDRAWALNVLRIAMDKIQQDYLAADKKELFNVLRSFLPGANDPPPYSEAATRVGMSEAALTSEIHRLRRQFREHLCAEVSSTVSAPHEIDEEIGHLYHVLIDRGTEFRPEEGR